MNELCCPPGGSSNRFPLSSTQEWWCAGDLGDQAGTFGPRFLATRAVCITGAVNVTALQQALDDVVERHEILRTIVVRDGGERYQQVYPPAPARLHVCDLPPVTDRSRDVYTEEVILRAEQGSMDVGTLPLLRAELNRFDDQDSVLILVTHHTAADGWSMQLILRDLAAFYTARTTGHPANLPRAPQYRELVAWEQARITGPDARDAMAYWRQKLSGARIFALPTDRPVPEVHTRPYSAHYFSIDADIMTATAALARNMRSSTFMVLLAAFNVLSYQITGTTDPVFNTFSTGRNEPKIQDIVGSVMNILPLRTEIGECVSFRDIVARSRETCLDAYSHEIPIENIEQELPDLMRPVNDPRLSYFIFAMSQPQINDEETRIAKSSYRVRKRLVQEPVSSEIPEGFAWNMDLLPSGELTGHVLYNLDEFDENTAVSWVSAYRRILSRAVLDPGEEWKRL